MTLYSGCTLLAFDVALTGLLLCLLRVGATELQAQREFYARLKH